MGAFERREWAEGMLSEVNGQFAEKIDISLATGMEIPVRTYS